MRLVSCLNPRIVVNPYTLERLTVACGKCDACKNRHASFWVKRLRAEQRSWRYCMFVTLTYDDSHLPTLKYDEVNDCAFDSRTGLRIPIHELITKDKRSNKYLFSRLRTSLGLPYCSTDIIQKFHKRLNKFIHDKYTQKYQNFRYFLATEYGGTTYRTHHHGLYFFNDKRVASDFEAILASTWQNTDNVEVGIKSEQVTGNAASYVAQYINSSTHLPAFYQNPKVKARYYYSKCPSLGSLEPLDETISELFFRCSPCRYEYNASRNTYDYVRIPFQVENRLYPRIARFRETNDSCRIRLYGLSRESDTFQDFQKRLVKFKKEFDSFTEYSPIVSDVDKEVFSYLNWLTNGFRFHLCDYIDPSSFKRINERVKRFFYLTRRVNIQASQFNVGLSYYLKLIDKYYANLDYYHLKNFYEVQSNYSSAHTCDDIPLMYTDIDHFLHSYECEVSPLLHESFAYKDLKATSKMIQEKNTKTHRKNDYFDKMRDKKLSFIIKDFIYG